MLGQGLSHAYSPGREWLNFIDQGKNLATKVHGEMLNKIKSTKSIQSLDGVMHTYLTDLNSSLNFGGVLYKSVLAEAMNRSLNMHKGIIAAYQEQRQNLYLATKTRVANIRYGVSSNVAKPNIKESNKPQNESSLANDFAKVNRYIQGIFSAINTSIQNSLSYIQTIFRSRTANRSTHPSNQDSHNVSSISTRGRKPASTANAEGASGPALMHRKSQNTNSKNGKTRKGIKRMKQDRERVNQAPAWSTTFLKQMTGKNQDTASTHSRTSGSPPRI